MSERARSRQFKNQGKGAEDGRRKRADLSVELRKKKAEDQIMKRRNVTEEPTSPLAEKNQNTTSPTVCMEMAEIVQKVRKGSPEEQYLAVTSARKILSRERSPPISDFISAGLVPDFVKLLDSDGNTDLQFEAAWALTNIASGNSEETMSVVKHNAVPRFVKLLKSRNESVKEQSVWALGNIAGDGAHLRDIIIEAGAIQPLIELITADIKIPFLRNLAWTLSNLCRNKNPHPPLSAVAKCVPIFERLLTVNDSEVLTDTCWALSYITDGTSDKIQLVCDAGVLPRLIELLAHSESTVVTPALRTIGNIVTGSDSQTQMVVETPGALSLFPALLHHTKAGIKKEAAWAISNITAGNQSQIQSVIDANIIPSVIELMEKGDFKSQKEAVWVITNLTSGGTIQQTGYVVEAGCIAPLFNLVMSKDSKLTHCVLDSVNNIMIAATKHGVRSKVAEIVEEIGGLDKLEELQQHSNEDIYEYASKIVDSHFIDEEDQDAALNPAAQSDQFQFANPAADSSQSNQFSF